MGFWKTVLAGVVLFAVTKVIELSASHLPNWLGWLGSAATWMWSIVTYEVSAPLYIAVVVGLVLLYSHDILEWGYGSVKPIDRTDPLASLGIGKEEHLVLDALIHADPPVDLDDLLRITQLSRLRVIYALDQLASKSLVTRYQGEIVLTKAGIKFIADNNLDKQSLESPS